MHKWLYAILLRHLEVEVGIILPWGRQLVGKVALKCFK